MALATPIFYLGMSDVSMHFINLNSEVAEYPYSDLVK